MELATPIKTLGRAYAMKTRLLEKLGLYTIEDLLYYIPYRYEDMSLISEISMVQAGENITVQGTVTATKNVFTRRRNFTIQKITIEDTTGEIECTWFNQIYLLRTVHKGDFLSVAGRVEQTGNKKSLFVKEYEILKTKDMPPTHTGRLVPVYSETRGLTSKWLRNRISDILTSKDVKIEDFFPKDFLEKYNLVDLKTALSQIHFPISISDAEIARKRLSFEELFITNMSSLKRKKEWEQKLHTSPFKVLGFASKIQALWESLPFQLTLAQNRAIDEISSDLARDIPMNRMLQGDVGSGKTVVASIAIYISHLNGFQSALMAPTEILAQQHFETVSKLLKPLGIKVKLFTSKIKPKENERFDIAIGTHALLQKSIKFKNLGLVVIDEQQRFGVEQRAILREKGNNPHFLSMTATPIPRTIFLTVYGDLNLSYLDEMPKGRKEIKTWLVPEEKRDAGYAWIKTQIKKTSAQVFIVCPFIEISETITTVKAATEEFERLSKDIFADLKLGLLHGKMKSSQKEEVLSKFKNGKLDILVATPVVEVGIDIPSATIIIIEGAERFGLAQLHQLRGRVGRSNKESYCLLFTQATTETARQRLKYLERMHLGAQLAELDLRLRGPGEVYGTLQHGTPFLKIASFSDTPLIKETRDAVQNLFPNLSSYPLLQEKLKSNIIQKVTPD
ncbi:MAG: DNA helicase RecG [Candidatus Levybacteria bacterium CG_4_10_14_0_2_um_filter_36_16]|nr:MAG: DNA helicase RecG [Candidatus Levybacteria bacterium CG10_big_fil_rev_8_21_14_0_10_36_30]PIZ97748.1 MAG: DNA helicase RecG [Candidatus Levybacteria bacterium CG_4_10_14_0_2_um_filter_36_16]